MNLTLLVLVLLFGVLPLGVMLIPATTRTVVGIRFEFPIDAVWEVYTDFENQPNWRSDLVSVHMAENQQKWTETLKQSSMTIHFEVTEKAPPNRLVLKTSSKGRFKGRYVAEFRKQGEATFGTFTEETTSIGVLSKVMRFLFFNQKKFIEQYAAEAKSEIKKRAAQP